MANVFAVAMKCFIGLMLALSSTAVVADYGIVVGSYSSQSNAQRAQATIEEYLQDRGIVAEVRTLTTNARIRVAVVAGVGESQVMLTQLRQQYPDAWRLVLEPAHQAVTSSPVRADPATAATSSVSPSQPVVKAAQVSRSDTAARTAQAATTRARKAAKPLAEPTQIDARIKGFALAADLPGSDWQRLDLANPTTDASADLRLMLNKRVGPLQFQLHHSTVLQAGDAVQWGQAGLGQIDQIVASDERRLADMTWRTDSGRRHQWSHRLDRFSVQWQQADWSVTLGRQAVSWGSGIVFQPLDPFNPFAPTAVDRDYKNGDDLVLVERLLPNGHDLQLLHVVRRDQRQQIRSRVSSTAAKWHGYMRSSEFELIVASHYDQDFIGLSLRQPLGPAVLRTDLAWREGAQSGHRWRLLGIVNADVAFPIRDQMAYVFAEYFYNDFGMQRMPQAGEVLPQQLEIALQRGEVFNLMREYLAVGASYQWHPLVTQSASIINNLTDGSALLQGQISVDAAQNQQLQLGYIGGFSDPGDEFAALPVAIDPQGKVFTQGGSDRYYLRWAWYF